MSIAKLFDLKQYIPKLFNKEPDVQDKIKETRRITKIARKPSKVIFEQRKRNILTRVEESDVSYAQIEKSFVGLFTYLLEKNRGDLDVLKEECVEFWSQGFTDAGYGYENGEFHLK